MIGSTTLCWILAAIVFSFPILYTVGTPLGQGWARSKFRVTNTDIYALNGIRTTIKVSEKAKTVHALDRSATVIITVATATGS
jgi:hypothetical protein